jgi:acetolactate synthase-1/2/3 large subunit
LPNLTAERNASPGIIEMSMITGGEIVVRTLAKAGVDTLFGIHGAHIDTIFQACRDHDLRIVDVRHEMAAGHAAEGYARVKRTLGVALVTAGGGFTNVITSIANAFLDRTPVLYITGSGALRDTETNTLQAGIDQVAVASPITKWAHRVVSTDQIPRLVAQGIRIARSAPRGPVLLDIPWDVLTSQVDETTVTIPAIPPTHGASPHPADIAAALALLGSAQRPIIVVGSEASRSNVGPVLEEFVSLNLLSGLGEANAGLIQGLHGFNSNGAAPDAVLQLGVRFGLNTAHGSGALLPLSARIVQIDPDARELGRLQSIELGIVADVGAALEALTLAAAKLPWKHLHDWRSRVNRLVEARYHNLARRIDAGTPIHPFEASRIVAANVDNTTAVVADGALTYLWLSETMSKACPGAFLTHGYLGSMGVGFGTAIGAQLAAPPGSCTILVTGDGAVGYSLAEFDTLVRQDIAIIVIVMNNRSWGATLHFQQYVVGPDRITNTRLENGQYHEVAAALGADSYFVDEPSTFENALRTALAKRRPACINVRVRLDPIPPEECLMIGKDPFPSL